MGRAPFDTKFRAVRHALFESFVPLERGSAPVYQYLIRSRAAVSQGAEHVNQEDVSTTGFKTAAPFVKLGVSADELGALLRSFLGDSPPSAAPVIGVRPELLDPSGALERLGVIAGMVFAMVTRASSSARLKWRQRLGWWRFSCLPRGTVPRDQEDKSVRKSRPGCVEVAEKDCFDEQYGHLPVRPATSPASGESMRSRRCRRSEGSSALTLPNSVGIGRRRCPIVSRVRISAYGWRSPIRTQ